jgi:endonuclease I
MNKFYSLLLLFMPCTLISQDYYQDINTNTSVLLRASLHELIKDHNSVSYGACVQYLKSTDEDPNNSNNIILIYKQNSISKEDFASNPSENDFWNREHVWASSLGGFPPDGEFGSNPAYSDLHNLKPSDKTVNSSKSNKSFDVGGGQHNEATECFSTNYTWEPPDNVKGDIARMLFYMDIRYEGDEGEPDLTVVEQVNTYPNPEIGNLRTLIIWHIQDPVDLFEYNRNEIIYDIQNNRNPFIDHPEYAEIIWEAYFNCINFSTLSYIEPCNQIEGCTDENACNYDVIATLNDESCVYPTTYYDCQSNCINDNDGDSVCDEIEVLGCTDSNALNYSMQATEEDSSCQYPIIISNALTFQGILDLDLPSAGNDGKAIHLIALADIADLSIFGIGVANNGGGSDGQEYVFEPISLLAGDNILLARSPEAMSTYFGDCFDIFEHVLVANSNIGHNGNDAIELFEQNQLIETFGDINSDGTGQDWEYIDSWAYKMNQYDWMNAEINCTENSTNTQSSSCPYPICTSLFPNQQTILITDGWSVISTYITSENPGIDQILSPLTDNLIIAKDYLGNAYLPQWGFNGIGDIQIGHGYYLKTNTVATLTLYGDYIQPDDNPINLVEGWSVVGYLRTEPIALDTIFESLVEFGFIIIIKDYIGAAYLPEWGYNGIGDMNPGQGYQIKTNGNCILQY